MPSRKKKVANAPERSGPEASYEVLSPIRFDGDDYAIGELVDLSEDVAEPLLLDGVIKLAPPQVTAPAVVPPVDPKTSRPQ